MLDTLLAKAAQIERIYEIIERSKLPRNRIPVGESHCNTSISVLLVDNNRHWLLYLTSVLNLNDNAVSGLMEV